MFTVGDRIGDYEIVARLRSGGMAALFLGRRAGASGFAKHVAIKVVHDHLVGEPEIAQMFVDEALLCAQIHHPNVVHVEELREIEGRHFLVMEYVYGGSLAQLLLALSKRKRRLTPELAAHIAIKLADGLHAAHEVRDASGELLGVVHRDVTPQNVLLAYQGTVKLIDFGVAKARGRGHETVGGSVKGKFRYMAPEQAFARDVDRRTDVYAIGIVLWEMLTMRQRFDAPSEGGVLNRVRYPEPIPPSKHAPDVSPELDAVVLKAMAVEPDDRYATAHELRDALVDVMPRAASLHESVLGQLLDLVLRDELSDEREKLPSSVSGMRAPAEAPATEVLETLTMSLADVDVAALADDATDPGELREQPTRLIDLSGESNAMAPPVVPFAAPPSELTPPPVMAPPSKGAGLPVPVLVGLVAALLALGGLGLSGGLLLIWLSGDDEEVVGSEHGPVALTAAGPVDGARADAGVRAIEVPNVPAEPAPVQLDPVAVDTTPVEPPDPAPEVIEAPEVTAPEVTEPPPREVTPRPRARGRRTGRARRTGRTSGRRGRVLATEF